MDAYRTYTLIDPDVAYTHQAVIVDFVGHWIPDTHNKIQKIESFECNNLSEIMEIVQKMLAIGDVQWTNKLRNCHGCWWQLMDNREDGERLLLTQGQLK